MLTKATFGVEAEELTLLSSEAAHDETTLSSMALFKHELITMFARSGKLKARSPSC